MKLLTPFLQLPIRFNAEALAQEISTLGEHAWLPHPQRYEGNDFLPLVSAYGEPTNEAFEGPMRPTPFLERCPNLIDALGGLGVTLGRTRLMRLSGHAEVTPHIDVVYYWMERMRVHIPIVTQPTVTFVCGTAKTHMAAGECWIFDTWSLHRVINDAERSRIHLVVDTVGGEGFWQLVTSGRVPGQSMPNWVAHECEARGRTIADLEFESENAPVVMTPWELREHISFLFSHVGGNQPRLNEAHQAVGRFMHVWRALWAAYGQSDTGRAKYRKALEGLIEDLHRAGAGRITLQNGVNLGSALHRMVLNYSLTDNLRDGDVGERRDNPQNLRALAPSLPEEPDPRFDRPIIIVNPPRSGSTLLFETLLKAPDVYTVGGESHAIIEGIPDLTVEQTKSGSNRLDADDAKPEIVAELRARFAGALRDRMGRSPTRGARVRMLEKTPKNALRIPFLAAAFPEARFVFLYRDPREVLASMMEAWQSGRFRTYPGLPGWNGALPWSMLLVPGWRDMARLPLNELVAAQWEVTMRTMLDDLEQVPRDRVVVANYSRLIDDPSAEVSRLCRELGLGWDTPIGASLPVASHTVSQPKKDKWKGREAELASVLPRLQSVIDRVVRFAGAEE